MNAHHISHLHYPGERVDYWWLFDVEQVSQELLVGLFPSFFDANALACRVKGLGQGVRLGEGQVGVRLGEDGG